MIIPTTLAENGKRPDYRLKKNEIIRGHKAIEKLIRKGIKKSGKYISIYYLDEKISKVAFVVSRKYRRAVTRNRLRRLLRENYRNNKDKFDKGFWLLFCKHSNEIISYDELGKDLSAALQKIEHNG